jgi:hypothetical protein
MYQCERLDIEVFDVVPMTHVQWRCVPARERGRLPEILKHLNGSSQK